MELDYFDELLVSWTITINADGSMTDEARFRRIVNGDH